MVREKDIAREQEAWPVQQGGEGRVFCGLYVIPEGGKVGLWAGVGEWRLKQRSDLRGTYRLC